MTSLLGSELSPAMMANGQVTMTAEKASADFYQLSGRRINWDLTDYHPLLAQRAISQGFDPNTQTMAMHPSVNYAQATEIREAVDRNFLIVLSDVGTKGARRHAGDVQSLDWPVRVRSQRRAVLESADHCRPGRNGTRGRDAGGVSLAVPVAGRARARQLRRGHHRLVGADAALRSRRRRPANGTRAPVAGFAGGGKSWVEAALVYKREPKAPSTT